MLMLICVILVKCETSDITKTCALHGNLHSRRERQGDWYQGCAAVFLVDRKLIGGEGKEDLAQKHSWCAVFLRKLVNCSRINQWRNYNWSQFCQMRNTNELP